MRIREKRGAVASSGWALAMPVALAAAALFHHLIDDPLRKVMVWMTRNWRERRYDAASASHESVVANPR